MIRDIEYIIVIYNNRTETMRLHQCLDRLGVRNIIIPTPNQLSSSCGLSLRTKYSNINKLIFCINQYNLSQNYKVYGENKTFNRTIYTKLK